MIFMIMIDRLISGGKLDPGGGLNLEGTGKYAPCLLCFVTYVTRRL